MVVMWQTASLFWLQTNKIRKSGTKKNKNKSLFITFFDMMDLYSDLMLKNQERRGKKMTVVEKMLKILIKNGFTLLLLYFIYLFCLMHSLGFY